MHSHVCLYLLSKEPNSKHAICVWSLAFITIFYACLLFFLFFCVVLLRAWNTYSNFVIFVLFCCCCRCRCPLFSALQFFDDGHPPSHHQIENNNSSNIVLFTSGGVEKFSSKNIFITKVTRDRDRDGKGVDIAKNIPSTDHGCFVNQGHCRFVVY